MRKLNLFFSSYIFLLLVFFFYTFTQVDLSLTLSKLSVYQTVEKSLQYLGFYQRPLSAVIFAAIAFLLFVFYVSFLYLDKKGKTTLRNKKALIFLTFIILVFSYNAFSYDLFNYIFDAKIITHYHQNPYFYKALDFPKDPMLSFMRWTHRVYPYGPSWLFLTVPLSFIGFGYFLPTFFLFKLLMGFSYLGSCYLVYKISEKIFPENKLLNLSFWAFNPLVIIESLVSAHNDIPMIFFMLLSIYLFLQKKNFLSSISYIFSVGIKFSTGILLPLVFLAAYFKKTKKKIDWEKFFIYSFILSLVTVFLATFRTTFQPWYLVFPVSMACFVPKKYYIFIPSLTASIFGVMVYVIYVYMTDYAKGYPLIISGVEITGFLAALFLTLAYFVKTRIFRKD